ncbi:hypothetical protein CesoFtcFv8_005383 [Champsocephalus esox]|uniref:Reelin domain-containing protein n=1 Tax=Champsocephalus esox TaxID=159716 RepID=A0AAN8H9B7_9TELE|nr:hypothetical protein CesoFtcFv8_005383 [Champsocephalus esox]
MVPDLVNKYLKMWLWIVISIETITKVHGYSNGRFPESCDSMSPVHTNRNGILYEPQSTDPPFEITYDPAPHGQPITVYLKSKQSNKFTGFMLEARKTEDVVGPAVGKFIVLDSRETRLLSCHSSPDNAVSQKFSSEKRLLAINWTSPQEENLDYTFRATFLQNLETFWEAVDLDVKARNVTKLQEPGTVLMIADSVLVAVKTELPLLITLLINGPRLHHLNKVKILSCVLCAAVEIPALVLFSFADPINVLFIALVCVAIAFNFMELFIVCLRIEPSHELKEISELIIKACSVIHCIFTTAIIFLGVLEFDNCGKEREDSWPVKVMMAYTVWTLLFVIWVYVSSIHRKTILGGSKIGSSKNRKERKKKKLSAAGLIVIAVQVIFGVGNLCFAFAVSFGIFWC